MHSVLTNVYKTGAQDMDTYYYLRQRLLCCDVEGKTGHAQELCYPRGRRERRDGTDV
jgi:hypothetical protein